MPATLRQLQVNWASLVDEPANQDARILLWKRAPGAVRKYIVERGEEYCVVSEDGKTLGCHPTRAEAARHLRAIEANKSTRCKECGMEPTKETEVVEPKKVETPQPAAPEADVTKRLQELEKALQAANDATKAANEATKAERDARLTAEYVTKAKLFKALPVEAEKFGPLMKRAADVMSAEDYAELSRVWKAADEAMQQAKLFREIGKGDVPDSGSAWSKIEAIAKTEREKDPSLTVQQARVRAMDLNPELEREYRRERAH